LGGGLDGRNWDCTAATRNNKRDETKEDKSPGGQRTTHKDFKFDDRTDYVHETKGHGDKLPEKTDDIFTETHKILHKTHASDMNRRLFCHYSGAEEQNWALHDLKFHRPVDTAGGAQLCSKRQPGHWRQKIEGWP